LREVAASSLLKLLALEFWWALLEESANAFAAILGRKTFYLLLDFLLQSLGEFFFWFANSTRFAARMAIPGPLAILCASARASLSSCAAAPPDSQCQPQRFRSIDHVAGINISAAFAGPPARARKKVPP